MGDDGDLAIVLLSLRVAACSVAALIVPSLALGWLLARRAFPGRAAVEAALHLPLVLPPVATGWLLLLLLGRHGWIGAALHRAGIDVAFTTAGAVCASAAMALPLMVRPIRLGIAAVDPALEDAARACGASRLRVALMVTLPIATPGIVAGCVLGFARALGEFGATITLAGSIPGVSRTIPLAIHQALQVPGGEARAARLTIIAAAIAVAAVAVGEWAARRFEPRRRG